MNKYNVKLRIFRILSFGVIRYVYARRFHMATLAWIIIIIIEYIKCEQPQYYSKKLITIITERVNEIDRRDETYSKSFF